MSYVVVCQSCGKKNGVPDDVFERRITGRKVTLRCKGCRQAIDIDGTDPVQRAKLGVPTISGATQRPRGAPAPAGPVPAGPPLLPALRPARPNAGKTLIGLAAPPPPPPVIAQPPAEPFEAVPPVPMAAPGKQRADATPPAVVMVPVEAIGGRPAPSPVTRDQRPRAASGGGWWVALSGVLSLAVIAAVAFAVRRDRAAAAAASELGRAPSAVELTAPAPSQGQPPVPAASAPPAPASSEVPAAPAVAAAEESEIPSTVDARTLLARTAVALRRAERCHPWGHAAGSADVLVTFAPRGRVIAARLEGEPLASAPVARCILEQARSVKIPAYEGEPFTLRQKITLR